MEKNSIFELFDYMTQSNKSAFTDDFTGWGSEASIPGYTSFGTMEGNGIKSEFTGEKYEPQCQSVRRGNHLEVQFRANGDLIKRITLGDLFPGLDVVIVTGTEAIRKIAPIFGHRSEVIDWMMLVHTYCELKKAEGIPAPWYWESDMDALATYLYQNQNPENKVVDESIYDRLLKV